MNILVRLFVSCPVSCVNCITTYATIAYHH